jgi:hypothetical protein
MPTYTVHEPPPRKNESVTAPERFVFVRDGFYFWAFLLAPVWLFVRRLWLALILYVVATITIVAGLRLLHAPPFARDAIEFLIALGIGFEAATIWRWTLARRKWKTLGFVVGEDREIAEHRFFAEWTGSAEKRADTSAPPPSAPVYATPIWRGRPAPSDVIGLFPEPGQQR